MSQGGPPPDDLSGFCCQNPDCSDYGRRGLGNLTVPARYGPSGRRVLRCRTCKARFSERKGTALFGAQLSEDKAVALLQHIAEGVGVRKTSRLLGVNKNTVLRYCRRAGESWWARSPKVSCPDSGSGSSWRIAPPVRNWSRTSVTWTWPVRRWCRR